MNTDRLEKWIGRTQAYNERIAPFPSNALAATLDRDDPEYADGTPLPPLWHWLHFLPVYKLSEAGYDGHAAPGGFLPPVSLPRRMWAGSRLTFTAPLRIGSTLRKVSQVKSIQAKHGRSGQLVFVTVSHQLFDGETLGVDEEHDIVYREEPAPGAIAPAPPQAPADSDFSREIHPDPVLLFRYSALTFNGHRIHYDQPFCVTSEGYKGLVVHGPLIATLLLDLLRRQRPGAVVKSFQFRALSAISDTESFTVHGSVGADGTTVQLWAQRQDGALAMQAEAIIA
ncbi:FAS1-like dehydratase domain-containing protein [Leisingera thetidis]|uniref:FAS1-like dehydratase domain-containing protein n=1 Tax=Leisingera thetidis TaxID=2930199 RepID=UPI0021F73341|nr:MaoC family dehydratase N-terminal domain-containing protein [Leisingera thetidis]